MKTRLAVSGALLVLALASDVLVGRELWRDYGFSRQKAARDAQATAQAVAHGIDLFFGRVTQSLAAVADVLRVHPRSFLPGDPALKAVLERHIRDAPMLRNLFVIGIDGTVLAAANYESAADAIARELAAQDSFADLWHAQGPKEGRLLIDLDPALEPATVPVALPVVGAAGAVIALVVADLAPTTIDDGAATSLTAPGTTFSIATESGQLIVCTGPGSTGCDESAAPQDDRALSATATATFGLTTTVRISTEEREERWLRFAAGVGGAAAAVTLGLPLLGWLFIGELQRRRQARRYLMAENERLARDYMALTADRDHREARMRVLIDRIHDGVLIVDRNGLIEDANAAAVTLLSADIDALIGAGLGTCIPGLEVPDEIDHADAALVQEVTFAPEGAAVSVFEVSFSRDCDLNLPHVLVVLRDITEQKKSQDRLRHMATVDGLTGVLNRVAFMEAARKALADRRGSPFTVAMIDADHFKSINDTHGHQAGDEVLRVLAKIIQGSVRSDDLVGRFGGEEFIVAMPGMGDTGAIRFVERLLAETRRASVVADGRSITFTVSIGWAVKPPDQCAALDALIGLADDHLYDAKAQGRDRSVGGRYVAPNMREGASGVR